MQQIVFASTNSGKYREVADVSQSFGVNLIAASSLIAVNGEPPDVDESDDSYLGNARLKAQAFHAWCGLPVLADDTGLEVDALGGRPGLFSARYAGDERDARRNVLKLLSELDGVSNRSARFYCALYASLDALNHLTAEAVLEGEIATQPRGAGGFGYDCVFVVREFGRTLAELKEQSVRVKTHRILACERIFTDLA